MTEELYALTNAGMMGRVLWDRGRDKLLFRYESDWQDAPSNYPLSLSMPLTARDHLDGKIKPFLWGLLPDKAILREDPRFRAFAKLDICSLSGRKLQRPRKSERQAVEFAYSAPKSVSIAAVNDPRIAAEMSAGNPHSSGPGCRRLNPAGRAPVQVAVRTELVRLMSNCLRKPFFLKRALRYTAHGGNIN
jgi:HipA-like protein